MLNTLKFALIQTSLENNIYYLRHFVPTDSLLSIYRSLILPHIAYGIAVWGQAAQTDVDKLLLREACSSLNSLCCVQISCDPIIQRV